MSSKVKSAVSSVLRKFGYEMRRIANGFHADPFQDQQVLMRGREVRTILDVGANLGQTAAAYRGLFPRAVIHSFEPFEESCAVLRRAVAGDDRVRVHQMAVTDAVGTRRFYTNRLNATNSLLPVAVESPRHVDASWTETLGAVDVPATTLDRFCADEGIDAVQILKMDIQGGERMALEGAAGLLGSGAVDLIYTEVLFAELYEGQADFAELRLHLARAGYGLYGLYNLTHGRSGRLAWGDAIFISPEVNESLGRP